MHEVNNGTNRCGNQQIQWKCGRRSCNKTFTYKKNSFFEKSNISEGKILLIIYAWLDKQTIDFMTKNIEISKNTVIDWKNFCREVCVEILKLDNKKIGGPGTIVEVDESKFGKRKHNRGKKVDGVWVLGGVCRETNETFFQVVEDRTAETIMPILIDNIHPQSTIITDCWKSYNNVKDNFYKHYTVNHSKHFVDPENKTIHTNNIENRWGVIKRTLLPKNGTNKSLYMSYFAEYCVSNRYLKHSKSKFHDFLELIKRVYPLEKDQHTPRKHLVEKENLACLTHCLMPGTKRRLPLKQVESNQPKPTHQTHSDVTASSSSLSPCTMSSDSDFESPKKQRRRSTMTSAYIGDFDSDSDF